MYKAYCHLYKKNYFYLYVCVCTEQPHKGNNQCYLCDKETKGWVIRYEEVTFFSLNAP